MLLFLCRHAQAAPGEPDELRELTPDGLAQARALGESLATRTEPPALVLSSPLVRARQTATAIAEATGAPLKVDERLSPGATVASLAAALTGEPGPVALVCHQPDCSEIALALSGRDPGFPVGSLAAIELDA
jgi:phosphohistidine phosphatase